MGDARQVPENGVPYASALDVPVVFFLSEQCVPYFCAKRSRVTGAGYWKRHLQREEFCSWLSHPLYAWMSLPRLPSLRVATAVPGCGHTVLVVQQALKGMFVLIL